MIRTVSVTSVEAFHSLMRLNNTTFVRQAYFTYFDMHLGDQDKSLAPRKVCKYQAKKNTPVIWYTIGLGGAHRSYFRLLLLSSKNSWVQ